MANLLKELNPDQLKAVTEINSPLLVIAGAGSGKTKVITHKIAYLITQGYQPQSITAITFTNKASREMQTRSQALTKQLKINGSGICITTFHSLGLKILKLEAHNLGYKPNFSILDSYDSGKIISDIATSTDKSFLKFIQNKISNFKNAFITPASANELAQDETEKFIAKVYQEYENTLKTYQAMDFDDLIKLPVELFDNNPEVLFKWQNKIQYLLIDEYQDTNECQYRLVKLLCDRQMAFTAVGDDDQSIYGWRGANLNNLLNLQNDFSKLKVIKLEQNYRSTNTILQAANSVIKNNTKLFEKNLWSALGYGSEIKIIACESEEAEAETIARKIMISQLQRQNSLNEYAILYRSNYNARIFEQALRNLQIPYTISGGSSFFEKAEIKDILAYLRLIINDNDDSAFIRAITTPKRGIGQVTLEKLATYAKNRHISLFEAIFEEGFSYNNTKVQLDELEYFGNFINNMQFYLNKKPPLDFLNELLTHIKYEAYLYEQEESHKSAEKKWENVLNLVNWIVKKAENDNKSLVDILHTITLISILEENDNNEKNAVKLSTIHAAKGLEYPYVYLVNCEENIIPHQESINNDTIEEERRLLYVGITRAQKELTISYCEKRKVGGELRKTEPSRFLSELGENVIDESKLRHQKINDPEILKDKLHALQNLLK